MTIENLALSFAAHAAGVTKNIRWSPEAVADLIEFGQPHMPLLKKADYLSREQIEVDADFIAFCANNRTEIAKALCPPLTDVRNSGLAVVEDDDIVIRVPIFELQSIADCAYANDTMCLKVRITDSKVFAEHIVAELNAQDHSGTTRFNVVLGRAMDVATNFVIQPKWAKRV